MYQRFCVWLLHIMHCDDVMLTTCSFALLLHCRYYIYTHYTPASDTLSLYVLSKTTLLSSACKLRSLRPETVTGLKVDEHRRLVLQALKKQDMKVTKIKHTLWRHVLFFGTHYMCAQVFCLTCTLPAACYRLKSLSSNWRVKMTQWC